MYNRSFLFSNNVDLLHFQALNCSSLSFIIKIFNAVNINCNLLIWENCTKNNSICKNTNRAYKSTNFNFRNFEDFQIFFPVLLSESILVYCKEMMFTIHILFFNSSKNSRFNFPTVRKLNAMRNWQLLSF